MHHVWCRVFQLNLIKCRFLCNRFKSSALLRPLYVLFLTHLYHWTDW